MPATVEPAPPRLRPLTAQEIPACAAIIAGVPLFERYGLGEEAARRLLTRALEAREQRVVRDAEDATAAELTVAELDGEAVGLSWFVPRGAFDRSGYLRLIVVDPRAQGRRVGQALLARLEHRHLARGGIVLLASEHNDDAHRFYERLGYRHVGTLPDYVKPGIAERIYFKPPTEISP